MGLRTDFVSLGAIGLGTVVAVVGTGGLLIAGAVNGMGDRAVVELEENGRCMSVSISSVARAPAPPRAPRSPRSPDGKVAMIRIVDGDVNVDVSDLSALGEAPLDVDLRVDCIAEFEREMEAREARAEAEGVRREAMEARERAIREVREALESAGERRN